MRITGQICFGREERNGYSAPVYSTALIDWAKDRFNGRENRGAVWIEVESGQHGLEELITRIRSESELPPHCWWQLHYSKAEFDKAKLLSVCSDSHIAELAQKSTSDPVSVKGNAKLKSPRAIGQIFGFPNALAVNSDTKERLENSTLKSVGFSQFHVVDRRPEHQSIWMIEPKVILPPSPMSLKKRFGKPFDGDFTTGCLYCQPYPNIELSYYATSLDSVEPFDMAGTHELIGNHVGRVFRHIIVSQQFRTWINESKLRGLRYTPVRLLEPGDPVVRDPFYELLRSVRTTVKQRSNKAEAVPSDGHKPSSRVPSDGPTAPADAH